jgi:hypothetical protein
MLILWSKIVVILFDLAWPMPIGIAEPLAVTGLIALLRGEELREAADGDQHRGRLAPAE